MRTRELIERLSHYADHVSGCRVGAKENCTCGLTELLKEEEEWETSDTKAASAVLGKCPFCGKIEDAVLHPDGADGAWWILEHQCIEQGPFMNISVHGDTEMQCMKAFSQRNTADYDLFVSAMIEQRRSLCAETDKALVELTRVRSIAKKAFEVVQSLKARIGCRCLGMDENCADCEKAQLEAEKLLSLDNTQE